jgi:hypothetical protein
MQTQISKSYLGKSHSSLKVWWCTGRLIESVQELWENDLQRTDRRSDVELQMVDTAEIQDWAHHDSYGGLETGSEAWLFPAYMDRAPAAAIDFIKGWGLNGISSCCLLTRQHRQSS